MDFQLKVPCGYHRVLYITSPNGGAAGSVCCVMFKKVTEKANDVAFEKKICQMTPDCTLLMAPLVPIGVSTCPQAHPHNTGMSTHIKHMPCAPKPPHFCTYETGCIHSWVHVQHHKNMPIARLRETVTPPSTCVLGGDPGYKPTLDCHQTS